MGKIADALRANLRELAQADARMLRDLDAQLPPVSAAPQPLPSPPPALADGLDALGLKDLKALCKQRGLKGYSSLKKPQLIARLRGGEESPPVPLPAAAAASEQLAAIEARLDRLEALLLKVADHLGVA